MLEATATATAGDPIEPIPTLPTAQAFTAPPETMDEAVARLSLLSPLEYDRARKAEAETLGVRAAALDAAVKKARPKTEDESAGGSPMLFDEPEPWPEPVNAAALLSDIEATIGRHIACAPETRTAAALWVAFTWFIDVVQVAPLAFITAPEKGCGKSTLLDLMGRMVIRPLPSSGISPAAVYRVIEGHRPTLLIDEADATLNGNEELRGVLNSGHTRGSATIVRTVGDEHVARRFSTWGAKAVAGIGKVAPTLMDRSIVLNLRRKLRTETVIRLRHADPGTFEQLARRLARLATDHAETIANARPDLPEGLGSDRQQDNWEPLLAVADLAGGAWPQKARNAALLLAGAGLDADPTARLSMGERLLMDIRQCFAERAGRPIPTVDLLAWLNGDAERPWCSIERGGMPLNPHTLSKRLKPYDVKSETLRDGYDVLRGYKPKAFADAFERYLGSDEAATSLDTGPEATTPEPLQDKACSGVAFPEKASRGNATPEPLSGNGCSGVAYLTGGAGHVDL